jgi:FkbM family methyltransferase
MNYKKFIPPIVFDLFNRVKKIGRSKYKIGKYMISIPPNFALPKLQSTVKLYDRFLPVLASKIDAENKLIIDVGANIGDTTIAMMQHCKNRFLCIEPSSVFLPYLEENIKNLSPEDYKRISIIKKLVGTGNLFGELKHRDRGTAHVILSDNPQSETHTRLDTLVDDSTEVILLKVDTDGFDFDVLTSAERIMRLNEPILFWENEISEDFQFNGFVQLYSMLSQLGYSYIYVFDNFGNIMFEEINFEIVKNINKYIYSMEKSGCSRTLYYTDILAVTEKYHSVAIQAIEEYRTSWINK